MTRQAPERAQRLLERFGIERQNEALIGDLVEEYQAGRSAAWYWWQALAAVASCLTRGVTSDEFVAKVKEDFHQHPLLAVRAIFSGWLVLIVWAIITSTLYDLLNRISWLPSILHNVTGYLLGIFCLGRTGWSVGGKHRGKPSMVLAFVGSFLFLWVLGFLFVLLLFAQGRAGSLFPGGVLVSLLRGIVGLAIDCLYLIPVVVGAIARAPDAWLPRSSMKKH